MKPVRSNVHLSKLIIKGFKSIKTCELELGAINILIGANGAGKSNFIGFFKMLQEILTQNLQLYVSRQGGPDSLLHYGRKITPSIFLKFYFGNNIQSHYTATFEPTNDNRLVFKKEQLSWNKKDGLHALLDNGNFETKLDQICPGFYQNDIYADSLKQLRVYHFHDTSESAAIKQLHGISDYEYLRPDASNLAAFLYFLQKHHTDSYNQIVKTIRLAAPFFGDFKLRPNADNKDRIELEWVEQHHDVPFKAMHLSDGTLRFMALATLLLQPEELQPNTILIDEPELGLHPYAITLLASLIHSVSTQKQVILSTQSVELLNEFEPNDVIVADRKEDASVFRRLDAEQLSEWLEDYSLGDLWKKNILGGRPA